MQENNEGVEGFCSDGGVPLGAPAASRRPERRAQGDGICTTGSMTQWSVVGGQPPIHGKMDMSAEWKDFNETKDFP